MARLPRVELKGGLYHVIARGNNRQAIFHSDEDYEKFLSRRRGPAKKLPEFNTRALFEAGEEVFQLSRDEFCSSGKGKKVLLAKEVFLLTGREAGATLSKLSTIAGISTAATSQRYDAAVRRLRENDADFEMLTRKVTRVYKKKQHRIKESKA